MFEVISYFNCKVVLINNAPSTYTFTEYGYVSIDEDATSFEYERIILFQVFDNSYVALALLSDDDKYNLVLSHFNSIFPLNDKIVSLVVVTFFLFALREIVPVFVIGKIYDKALVNTKLLLPSS